MTGLRELVAKWRSLQGVDWAQEKDAWKVSVNVCADELEAALETSSAGGAGSSLDGLREAREIVENEPLGYLTERDHVVLENYADRVSNAIQLRILVAEAALAQGSGPEMAWLIERCDGAVTQWLACDSLGFEWTSDPLKPIRFSRREDAEQLALFALPNRNDIDMHITEHKWGL